MYGSSQLSCRALQSYRRGHGFYTFWSPKIFSRLILRLPGALVSLNFCTYQCKAGRGGGDGGEGGRAWSADLTFFKNLPSNSLPTGKTFQSNATKFPHPGLHIAIKYPKAEPKKGTMKISPNKTLQSLFINVATSPKIHVPVQSCNYTF